MDVSRRLRPIISFFRAICCFWTFLLAEVSINPSVGSPKVLVSELPYSGYFSGMRGFRFLDGYALEGATH